MVANPSTAQYIDPSVDCVRTLIRSAQLLVEGMAKHALSFDSKSHTEFKAEMRGIGEELTTRMAITDYVSNSEQALRALQEYNHRAAISVEAIRAETVGIVTLCMQTVAAMSANLPEHVIELWRIQAKLSEAKTVADIRGLRPELESCLYTLRTEAKTRVGVAGPVAPHVSAGPPRDPLTDLILRDQAEKDLAVMCAAGAGAVGILTIDRLQLYNARYGRKIGDGVLSHFAKSFQELAPKDFRVYRWSGPTLLVLIKRAGDIEDVKYDIKRTQERITAYEADLETRQINLAMTSKSAIFPVAPNVAAVVKRIEMIAAVQGAGAVPESEIPADDKALTD